MNIKPIKTKADYQTALKDIETLMDAKPRTPKGDRLEVLVTLVEAYEAKHYPLDLPDPVEAIKYTMESKGLTVKDLEPMIGRSNRVYEILSRKRAADTEDDLGAAPQTRHPGRIPGSAIEESARCVSLR